jgi:plasmid maintenance system antidote protein VapI
LETLTKQRTQGKTPGQIIDEMRQHLAWEISHLTQALGIQEWDTCRLLADEMPIDFEMAVKLADAFQTSTQFWLCPQKTHDACTRRFDREGRDVTDFPALWDKSDEPEISPHALNKKLIAALAGMCSHLAQDILDGRMTGFLRSSDNALKLLAEIGVVIEVEPDEYEFAPGFDPAPGEWQ